MATEVKTVLVKWGADTTGYQASLNKIKSSTNDIDAALKKIKNSILGFAGAYIGFEAIRNGFSGLTKSVVGFDTQFANVTTLIPKGTYNLEQLKRQLLELPGNLGSVEEKTKALYWALSSGIQAADAVKFVGDSAKLAKAGVMELEKSVDVLTSILNAYGMQASESARVSDILFQVIKDGKVTGEQLAGALGSVIPTAAQMGVSIEEVGAAIATMTQSGISGDEAVTALNQTLLSIIGPTDKAAKYAKQLGIDMSYAGVEGAGGLQQYLMKLKDATGGNIEILNQLFPNVRALKGVLSLTGEQAKIYTKELIAMKTATGTTAEAFDKQQKAISAVFDALKNDIESTLIETLLPVFQNLANYIKNNKDEIAAFAKNLITEFKNIIEVVQSLLPVIKTVSIAFAGMFVANKIADGMNLALKGIQGFTATIGKILPESFAGSFAKITDTTKFWSAGMSKEFAMLASIGAGIAVTIAIAFREAMAMIIAEIDAQIARIQGDAKKESDNFAKIREIRLKGTAEEKKAATEMLNWSGKMADLAVKKIAESEKYYSDMKAIALGKQLEINKKSVESTLARIKAEDEALSKVEAIRKSGTAEEKKRIDELIAKYGDQRKSVVQVAVEYDKQSEKIKKDLEKAKVATEKAAEAQAEFNKELAQFSNQIGVLNIDDLNKETLLLNTIWGQSQEQIKGNTELIEKMRQTVINLTDKYKRMSTDVPESLGNLKDALSGLYMAQVPVSTQVDDLALNSIPQLNWELDDYILQIQRSIEADLKAAEKKKALEEANKSLADVFNSLSQTIGQSIGALEAIGLISQKTAGALNGLSGGINTIGAGFNAIQQANKTGGFLGTLGKISGAISIATGALSIFSSVLSIFKRKSGELKETERILRGIGIASKDLAKKLEAEAKAIGGVDSAARAFNNNLAAIIKSNEKLIDVKNLDKWVAKVRETFSTLERGHGSAAEAFANFSASFEAIIPVFEKLGLVGSAAFTGLILEAEEFSKRFGMTVEAVEEFKKKIMEAGYEGYKAFKEAIDTTAILTDIEKLNSELNKAQSEAAKQSTELEKNLAKLRAERDKMKAEMVALKAKIAATTDKTERARLEEELAGLKEQYAEINKEITATVEEQKNLFNTEEIKNLQTELENLQNKYKGIKDIAAIFGAGTIDVFEQMYQLEQKVAKNPELTNAIKGWQEAFIALSSTTRLTQEQFNEFGKVSVAEYNKLIDARFTDAEALKLIAPQLQQLAMLQGSYGYMVDESTAALIEQARQQGLITAGVKTDGQIIGEGFEGLGKIIKTDLVDAIETLGDTIKSSIGGALNGIKTDITSTTTTMGNQFTNAANVAITGINKIHGEFSGLNKDITAITKNVGELQKVDLTNLIPDGGLNLGLKDELPKFARGGDMMVKGIGGIDSQVVSLRATPGETISVRNPGGSGTDSYSTSNITFANTIMARSTDLFEMANTMNKIADRNILGFRDRVTKISREAA